MRNLALILGLLAMMLTVPAQAQGPRFDFAGCDPRFCAESDWIYDDTSNDHTTVWRHRLGATPRSISILFTPDPDRGPVMPLVWPWQLQQTGNPAGLEMNDRAVRLHIWSGAPMHGIWQPGKGWTIFRKGYWKFVVYR